MSERTIIKHQVKDNQKIDYKGHRKKGTIAGSIDRFITYLIRKSKKGQLSQGRIHNYRCSLRFFMKFLQPKKCFQDNGITEINSRSIMGFADHLFRLVQEGKYKPQTANQYMGEIKQFVLWCYATKVFDDEPVYLHLIKKIPVKHIDPKLFTIEQIQTLFYACKNNYQGRKTKLYILLALNCGFTSKEIGTLAYEDIDFENQFIHKRRSKTGHYSRWKLWNITNALLLEHKSYMIRKKMQPIYDEGNIGRELVFQTPYGNPVFWIKVRTEEGINSLDGARHLHADSVASKFHRLRKKVYKDISTTPPFKNLRKTGANLLRIEVMKLQYPDLNIVSRMYLNHTINDTFSRSYYSASLDDMNEPLMALEKVLGLRWENNKK